MIKFEHRKRVGDKMKKKAFTIAEILITIGIIGVVAALTLPVLTEDSQKKVYASKLSAAVSDIENAMTTMLMKEGEDMLQLTPAWTGKIKNFDGEILDTDFLTELNKTMPHKTSKIGAPERENLDKSNTIEKKFPSDNNFRNHKGAIFSVKLLNNSTATKKETEMMAKGCAITSVAAEVYIDVNGEAKPNTWGRDTFIFVLDGDGHLYPYGGKDWSIYNNRDYKSTTPKTECVDNKNSDYCAAYLVNNGYKMDY